MDWNDLNIVLAIGRSGSLSGAAKLLELNHSTVFRRINAIENKVGVRFFDRLPTGYVITEAGEAAMRAAENIDNEVNSLSRELVGKDLRLQGTLRLTAPEGVSLVLLGPALSKFCKTFPDIQIDLVVTGSTLQLSRREADLAVRVTRKPPDTSIGRRVCRFGFGIYASKSYLKKHKRGALENDSWLLPDDSRDWFPASVWKKLGQARAKTVFSSNSTMATFNACKDGQGVAPLPCFLGDGENKLFRVVEPAEEMALDLWLLMHPDLRHTARVRTLMTFLYECLSEKTNLIEGNLSRYWSGE